MMNPRKLAVLLMLLIHFATASAFAEERFSVGDEHFKMFIVLRGAEAPAFEYEAAGRQFPGLRSFWGTLETDAGRVTLGEGGPATAAPPGPHGG